MTEKPQKNPKNFAEFYQEMKTLMDSVEKKTGEKIQSFYDDIDKRIKTIEGKGGKTPVSFPESLPTERNMFDLKYSTTGAMTWDNGTRADFEKAMIDLMVKYRLVNIKADLSIKKFL